MPRRNLLLLVVLTLLAIACFMRPHKNPYLNVMADAIDIIERKSLEPVDDKRLFEGAMHGMLDQFDKNSRYIPQKDMDNFRLVIDGEFAGVGIEVAIDLENKLPVVRSPMVGSPAYDAGVLAGDRILSINGKNTLGMDLPDVVAMLRGPEGSSLSITVLHVGEKEPVKITLVRELLHVDTVVGDTRNEDGSWNFPVSEDGVGYVRVDSFSETTAAELEYIIDDMLERGMRGLVLDMRDNPGGWLAASVQVAGQFISSGVIVTIRRQGGRISESYTASGDGRFTDFPIAVIVNQETASAAEIVSACLQDHDRAVVVGQRSYGKGTVQEVIELQKSCGAMKLTTANYWRPSGKNIQRPRDAKNGDWGVKPNKGFEVKLTNDEYVEWQQWRVARDAFQRPNGNGEKEAKPYVDRQREKAVEYVRKQIESLSKAAP